MKGHEGAFAFYRTANQDPALSIPRVREDERDIRLLNLASDIDY